MKKIISAFLFLSLTSGALNGMNRVATTTDSALPLTKENAWLVHATEIFPKNGVLVAGATASMEGLDLSLEQRYDLSTKMITAVRNTLYWSVNSLV